MFQVKEVEWTPGTEWECGELTFSASAKDGTLLVWKECVPGTRHSDEAYEVEATFGGKPVDFDACDPPDFEIPRSDGTRAARRFFNGMSRIVQTALREWSKETIALRGKIPTVEGV